jgi:hypothetical protein
VVAFVTQGCDGEPGGEIGDGLGDPGGEIGDGLGDPGGEIGDGLGDPGGEIGDGLGGSSAGDEAKPATEASEARK